MGNRRGEELVLRIELLVEGDGFSTKLPGDRSGEKRRNSFISHC